MWVGAGWVGPGYEHYGWSFTYDPSAPDTVIGGVAYMNWNGMPVRESGTGQVYYRRPWMEEDLLWYDYDVAVGDTVRFGEVMGFPSVDAVRVVSVDTVFLGGYAAQTDRSGILDRSGRLALRPLDTRRGKHARAVQYVRGSVGLRQPVARVHERRWNRALRVVGR